MEIIKSISNTIFSGWETEKNGIGVIHIYPSRDLKFHDISAVQCGCKPLISIEETGTSTGIIASHNSYDGREFFEYEYSDLPDYFVYKLFGRCH